MDRITKIASKAEHEANLWKTMTPPQASKVRKQLYNKNTDEVIASLEGKNKAGKGGIVYYIASRDGRLWSVKNGKKWKELNASTSNDYGYMYTKISFNGYTVCKSWARFIFHAFNHVYKYQPEVMELHGFQIDHIDGNNKNNHIENLQALTAAENCHNRDHVTRSKNVNAQSVEIYQLNENGQEINIESFESYKIAREATGLATSTICRIIKSGRPSQSGYYARKI